jgi:hypothetical protein
MLWNTFLFKYLCFLPDEGPMERPKHAAGKQINVRTKFEYCVCLDFATDQHKYQLRSIRRVTWLHVPTITWSSSQLVFEICSRVTGLKKRNKYLC